MSILSQVEPNYYLKDSKHPQWVQAMAKEITALERTYTWIITDLPPNKTTIGCNDKQIKQSLNINS